MQTLDRTHRAPAAPLPPHAADCPMHVFGPFEGFPRDRACGQNIGFHSRSPVHDDSILPHRELDAG